MEGRVQRVRALDTSLIISARLSIKVRAYQTVATQQLITLFGTLKSMQLQIKPMNVSASGARKLIMFWAPVMFIMVGLYVLLTCLPPENE